MKQNMFKEMMTQNYFSHRVSGNPQPSLAGVEVLKADVAQGRYEAFCNTAISNGDYFTDSYTIYPYAKKILFAAWCEETPQEGIEFLVDIDSSFPPIIISWE